MQELRYEGVSALTVYRRLNSEQTLQETTVTKTKQSLFYVILIVPNTVASATMIFGTIIMAGIMFFMGPLALQPSEASASLHGRIIKRQAVNTRLATVGFSTNITCSFSSSTSNYVLTWKKDGNIIKLHDPHESLHVSDTQGQRFYTITSLKRTATLHIKNVTFNDAGDYVCMKTPTFTGNSEMCSWVINVQGTTTVVWKPPSPSTTSIIVERYTCVDITCISEGYPPVNVTLQKYTDYTNKPWINTDLVPRIKLEGNQTTWYFVYNLTSATFDRLRCFADNSFTKHTQDQGFIVETKSTVPPQKCLILKLVNGKWWTQHT
ncbi:uncharacterized protein [Apostichopus japonicus]|uniref:uncharacterized protein isoform X2 n=1 Tax=Stichopus japonicus TaxID=307972 RepID=UPI003AB609CA